MEVPSLGPSQPLQQPPQSSVPTNSGEPIVVPPHSSTELPSTGTLEEPQPLAQLPPTSMLEEEPTPLEPASTVLQADVAAGAAAPPKPGSHADVVVAAPPVEAAATPLASTLQANAAAPEPSSQAQAQAHVQQPPQPSQQPTQQPMNSLSSQPSKSQPSQPQNHDPPSDYSDYSDDSDFSDGNEATTSDDEDLLEGRAKYINVNRWTLVHPDEMPNDEETREAVGDVKDVFGERTHLLILEALMSGDENKRRLVREAARIFLLAGPAPGFRKNADGTPNLDRMKENEYQLAAKHAAQQASLHAAKQQQHAEEAQKCAKQHEDMAVAQALEMNAGAGEEAVKEAVEAARAKAAASEEAQAAAAQMALAEQASAAAAAAAEVANDWRVGREKDWKGFLVHVFGAKEANEVFGLGLNNSLITQCLHKVPFIPPVPAMPLQQMQSANSTWMPPAMPLQQIQPANSTWIPPPASSAPVPLPVSMGMATHTTSLQPMAFASNVPAMPLQTRAPPTSHPTAS